MNVEVEYGKPVRPPIEKVTVEMTPEEAEAFMVLGYVMGGEGEIRQAVDRLYDALKKAGVKVPVDYLTEKYGRMLYLPLSMTEIV